MKDSPEQLACALSPDGVWRFEDGMLRSAAVDVEPFAIDFFSRWTFARFLRDEVLALGFESSQPWGEGGSYGDRYGGVQVLALTAAPATWSPVALEFDYRRHDETFIPTDVAWHPRGVLAWLRDGELCGQVLTRPRGIVAWDLLPPRDSDQHLAFSFSLCGSWRTLTLDPEGRILTACDDEGCDRIDLELRRHARDGQQWQPLDVWSR